MLSMRRSCCKADHWPRFAKWGRSECVPERLAASCHIEVAKLHFRRPDADSKLFLVEMKKLEKHVQAMPPVVE